MSEYTRQDRAAQPIKVSVRNILLHCIASADVRERPAMIAAAAECGVIDARIAFAMLATAGRVA